MPLVRYVWNIGNVKKLTAEGARKGIRGTGIELLKLVRRSLQRQGGGKPSPAGKPPHRQTGEFVSSMQMEIHDRGFMARVGTAHPSGRKHEIGGYIKAKGKALAIPLHHRAWRAIKLAGGKLQPVADKYNLRYVAPRGGSPLMVKKIGEGGSALNIVDPWFVFKKQVYLPPRPYLRPALKKLKNSRVVAKHFKGAF